MKYLVMILMSVLTLALMVGAIIFVSNRFALYFPALSYKKWLWIMGSVLVLMMAGQAFSVSPNIVGRFISNISSIASAIVLYLFLSVVVIELFSLLFHLMPINRGILSLFVTAIIFAYGIFNAYNLKVNHITIPIEGLTKEIKAVHITDIHLGNFRGEVYLDKIVDKINELQPNVVFNTGDQFDSKAHFSDNKILQAYKRLTAPQYFVYGNHDVYVGVEDVVARMKATGAVVLQNEIKNFGELQIVGLNNMAKDSKTFDMHATPGEETVESVMAKLPINESRPTIVLHHRPDGVEYMSVRKADLLLSGHTHGGQMFPITYIAKQMFKYNSGLYQYNTMSIYVSNGAGSLFAPLRLGTSSEITLIKLVPKK